MLQFTDHRFESLHDLTIGVEFGSCIKYIKDSKIKLQIWDTAGSERYRSLIFGYYKNSNCIVIIFDITNRISFNGIIFFKSVVKS